MEKLLTVKQVADILNCHSQTVYKNKQIPCVKLPGGSVRYRPSDIDKYIENRTVKPSPFISQISDNATFSLIFPPDYGKIKPNESGGNCGMAKAKSKTRYNFGYGAIYQRKTKNGKIRWYLDYRDGSGKRIQKVAPLATTREEAGLALQQEVAREYNREYGIKRDNKKINFKDFVGMFIENYSKVNKSSWKDDKYRLQKFMSFFGNIYLDEVTPLEIEKFKSVKLEDGLTKTTVNHYLKVLKRLFNIAISWEYANNNPVRHVALYSEKDALKERILSEEEEVRLLEASAEHVRPIIVIALNTGMRRGEILNLKWEQIDFQAKEIRVQKTKSGRPRIVDVNSLLLEELMKLKSESRGSQYVFLNPKTGNPYTKLHRSFKRACHRAGIKDLRFHDLRHTFASRLVEKGVDIIRVKELLGHSSVKITERYTHSNREERKKAVELLCQESVKIGKNLENLLHSCDMEKSRKRSRVASSLFSVN